MIKIKPILTLKDLEALVPGSFVEFFPDANRELPVGPALYVSASDDLRFRFVGHVDFKRGFMGISIPREQLRPDGCGCGTLDVISLTSLELFEPSPSEVMHYESLERA
jgi:hypothetical protein